MEEAEFLAKKPPDQFVFVSKISLETAPPIKKT